MPCASIARFAARKPPSEPIPRAECGSVWPGAKRLSPSRGSRRVDAAWQFPGTASYSA